MPGALSACRADSASGGSVYQVGGIRAGDAMLAVTLGDEPLDATSCASEYRFVATGCVCDS